MGKRVDDSVLDGALDVIKNNCNGMQACSAEPTTRTEAVTTYELAAAAMTSGDFTHANGDTSGRKTTVAAQSGETVDNTGTATHVSLTSASLLLYVTTCTSQALTSGNTVNFPAWKIEIADPS